jgi:hypothetical protein
MGGGGTKPPATVCSSPRRSAGRRFALLCVGVWAFIGVLALGAAPGLAESPRSRTDPGPLWRAYPLDPPVDRPAGREVPSPSTRAQERRSDRTLDGGAQGRDRSPPSQRQSREVAHQRRSAAQEIALAGPALALAAAVMGLLYWRRRAQRTRRPTSRLAPTQPGEGPSGTEARVGPTATATATLDASQGPEAAAAATPVPRSGRGPESDHPRRPTPTRDVEFKRHRVTQPDRDMYVEGQSTEPNVGRFTGRVHSIVMEEDADGLHGRPIKYLVLDRTRWLVFWVDEAEIVRISTEGETGDVESPRGPNGRRRAARGATGEPPGARGNTK